MIHQTIEISGFKIECLDCGSSNVSLKLKNDKVNNIVCKNCSLEANIKEVV